MMYVQTIESFLQNMEKETEKLLQTLKEEIKAQLTPQLQTLSEKLKEEQIPLFSIEIRIEAERKYPPSAHIIFHLLALTEEHRRKSSEKRAELDKYFKPLYEQIASILKKHLSPETRTSYNVWIDTSIFEKVKDAVYTLFSTTYGYEKASELTEKHLPKTLNTLLTQLTPQPILSIELSLKLPTVGKYTFTTL